MHAADNPAEAQRMIQRLQAVPGLVRSRHVNEREADARHKLQNQQSETGAAEDVEPACRVARYMVRHRIHDSVAKLQPEIQPLVQLFDQAHEHPFPFAKFDAPNLLSGWPSVGISPASIKSAP